MKHSALFRQLCQIYYVKPDAVPTVSNVHQKILKALKKGGTLNMEYWHGNDEDEDLTAHKRGVRGQLKTCGTTHCHAGWIVHFAGQKGYRLADRKYLDVKGAASLILAKSNPKLRINGELPNYYDTPENALAYIKREARREARA